MIDSTSSGSILDLQWWPAPQDAMGWVDVERSNGSSRTGHTYCRAWKCVLVVVGVVNVRCVERCSGCSRGLCRA